MACPLLLAIPPHSTGLRFKTVSDPIDRGLPPIILVPYYFCLPLLFSNYSYYSSSIPLSITLHFNRQDPTSDRIHPVPLVCWYDWMRKRGL